MLFNLLYMKKKCKSSKLLRSFKALFLRKGKFLLLLSFFLKMGLKATFSLSKSNREGAACELDNVSTHFFAYVELSFSADFFERF
jgi:hypothetical protein